MAETDAEQIKAEQTSEEQEAAQKAEEKHESARETMDKLEASDEPPTNLDDWPSDEAKYVTYGGAEGDHSYEEGPEKKLGPSSLERHRDGSVSIEGEEVDDPDEYKADPIPGGPTDPDATELRGERKKREKMEKMYGEEGETDAVKQVGEGKSRGEDEGESG